VLGLDDDKTLVMTSTLFASGLILERARRVDDVVFLTCYQEDDFGCRIRYLIAFSEKPIPVEVLASAAKVAQSDGAYAVIVGSTYGPTEIPVLTLESFLARFGGPVRSLLPLKPTFGHEIQVLGDNRLPDGISGRPDDLFEEYVRAGLQFITGRRVVRYGQSRRGESVPDGYMSLGDCYILYDAKAAGGGYEVDAATVRQCSSYVRDFTERYEHHQKLYAFLVVSGQFSNPSKLDDRSRELYADSRVPLVFLTAVDLAAGVEYFKTDPVLRETTDWKAVFAKTTISADTIRQYAKTARRDGIVRGRAVGNIS